MTARRVVRRSTALWLFCAILCARQIDGPIVGWANGDTRALDAASQSRSPSQSRSLSLSRSRSLSQSQARTASQSELQSESDAHLLSRFEFTEPHMGTQVRLVLYAASAATARTAARAAFDRVAALDRTLSDYQSTSELMQLCARAGEGPIAVSADLFRVLEAAHAVARRTNGAFDVTSGPLTRLWRRARRLSELPATDRVVEAHALTGYRLLTLDPHARTASLAKPGMSLDVGGIAKGFTGDEAMAVLASYGVTRALVGLGGDIVVSGPPPGRAGWTIDIASLDAASLEAASLGVGGAPRQPETLLLRDAAVSTAGDAEQWLAVNGVRYSHILDPRTGWPMTIRSSTTVIARRGLESDSLDTALAVLGPEGLPIIEETAGAAALLVRQEANGHVTATRSSRWPESQVPKSWVPKS